MSRMEFDHDFVNPEEEKGLDENEEGEGINQPQSGENKCSQCDYRHDICQKIYATTVLEARILRKKRVNRNISQFATKERKCFKMA